VVIPTLEGIAAPTIEVQTRAARHQRAQLLPALEEVPPAAELVQLVEDDQAVMGNSRARIRERASSSSQLRYRSGARGCWRRSSWRVRVVLPDCRGPETSTIFSARSRVIGSARSR
jgi:hypothetical protein